MKLILTSILTVLMGVAALAQLSQDYTAVMEEQKNVLKTAVTENDFGQVAANFERIADTAKGQWHPLYYAALSYINRSFVEKEYEKKDADLDKAQKLIDIALEIYPEESELWVLQGLLYQGKLQVDPMKRGKEYSGKAGEALRKAKEFNPENPRIYYLLGMNVLHTPKMFGGGPEAACPLFAQAAERFGKEVPANVLSPAWGAEENDMQIAGNCPKTK
jgi:tetratricopeptide (TPR) repeat protein